MWEGITLDQAKAWLRKHVDEGAHCPCCNQFTKVYRRKVHASMARSLITLVRRGDWVLLADVLPHRQIADSAKLKYWELIEEHPTDTPKAGKAGLWRATERGRAFAHGTLVIPKYARIYDGRCLGFDGPLVDIRDALGDAFSLEELMSA